MKDIVILGGSYGALGTAHRILKQRTKTTEPFKITLVAPNTHLYWNMASPRGLIPGQFTDDQLFRPIAEGFKKYTEAGQFEFIVGSADSVDVEAKRVEVSVSTGNTTLSYDFLILATGSRTKERTPFKTMGSTEETIDTLHDYQDRVRKAKSIVVAGGGVTSVEIAGELAFEYGQEKKIMLLTGSPAILAEAPASVSKLATRELENLNVTIKTNTRVSNSFKVPGGGHEITLSGGEQLATDLYIPLFGLDPNSSYLPPKFLNAKGFVKVGDHLDVEGADAAWAIGDVSDVEFLQYVSLEKQSAYVAKTIVSALSGKASLPYKPSTSRFMGLQVGKKAGTGHYGAWKIPSFIIVFARKNLFIDNLGTTVDGSQF